jgi:hypothetical protein
MRRKWLVEYLRVGEVNCKVGENYTMMIFDGLYTSPHINPLKTKRICFI